ncbi:hypothetical protein OG696_01745 [Streptomyces sp. NBC_00656]|uniref:hypothetical protein n=1 Tax=Streptomyces sp. NBC_00656 TaxID=2903668 RepID=UPI003248754A
MGAEHVIGAVGIVVVVAGAVAVALILRSGSVLRPAVVHPLCATCGHAQPEHRSGGGATRCHHAYGHSSWNDDSYGNSGRRFGEVCRCPGFRHQDGAA